MLEKFKSNMTAPTLAAVSFGLLLLARITGATGRMGNEYLSVIILQLLILAFPAILYVKLRGRALKGRLRVRAFGGDAIILVIWATLLLICGSLLLNIVFADGISDKNFSLYDTAAENGGADVMAFSILAYAILPAVCEEFFFRSVLCAEYEGFGIGSAAAISSILFAMLHFRLSLFPVYFYAGLLLFAVMYACRSCIASMTVHFFFNLYGLYGQSFVSEIFNTTGSTELFLIILATCFAVFLLLFCGQAARIYRKYSERNIPSDYLPQKKKIGDVTFPDVFLAPAAIVCYLIFFVAIFIGS